MTMLPSHTLHSPPVAPLDTPALVDCIGHWTDEPSQTRYRRPRQFRELPRCFPRTLRLAARGAMPSRPSLLPTIMEVDESLHLDADPNYLARSPSPSAAKCDESSRKRRTPDPEVVSDLWAHMCLSDHPMPFESLEAILTPDAMEHWKRLRGMGTPRQL
ncbi:hypothetical protein T484DRAFT_1743025 [Baffinella frigidus]|nr:hypothetical protein T484DRAFT_1743025 [Cryptophyta sp. CCMP2293]